MSNLDYYSSALSSTHITFPNYLKVSAKLASYIIPHPDIHYTTALLTNSYYICTISNPMKHTVSGIMTTELKDLYQFIYS
ncbi:MAG: hypothetical protein AB8U25_04225 [Rickettsiales endosymbiont of Dermacentor nuttalli]